MNRPTPTTVNEASAKVTQFKLRYDMDRLRRVAEDMFSKLPDYRRREIYEYQNRLNELTRLQQDYIAALEQELANREG